MIGINLIENVPPEELVEVELTVKCFGCNAERNQKFAGAKAVRLKAHNVKLVELCATCEDVVKNCGDGQMSLQHKTPGPFIGLEGGIAETHQPSGSISELQ